MFNEVFAIWKQPKARAFQDQYQHKSSVKELSTKFPRYLCFQVKIVTLMLVPWREESKCFCGSVC